jgi:CHAD domain-containing protein
MARATEMPPLPPETPLAEAARHALALRLGDLEREADALAQTRTSDGVHDTRVATRRMRAALALAGELEEARAEVKRFGDALGGVRDLDVRVEWLAERLSDGELPTDARAGLERLLADQRAALPPREVELVRALDRFRSEVVARLRRAFERAAPTGKLGGKPVERMRKHLRRVGELAAEVLDHDDPYTAHQLRIRAKKMRYEAELIRSARPDAIAALLAHLVPLQKTLGDLHDADVREPLISHFLVRAAPDERAGGILLLAASLADRTRLSVDLSATLRHWRDERTVETLRDRLK